MLTTFTPPTSFTIDSTNVKFCSNFDSVYDKNYKMVQHLGNTLTDASGSGNSGTATGTTLVDTIYGKGRSFNGTSDFVSCGTSTDFDIPYSTVGATVLALTKVDAFTTVAQTILGKDASGVNAGDWSLDVGRDASYLNYYRAFHGNAVPTDYFAYSNSAAVATEYHVPGMKGDANGFRIFVDGTAQTTNQATDNYGMQNTSPNLVIGARRSDSGYLDGTITEVRIERIARSDTWILLESLSMKNSAILITISEYVPGAVSLKVNIGGTWKLSNDVKVNIGGVWKTVESIKVNIGGVWKSIT